MNQMPRGRGRLNHLLIQSRNLERILHHSNHKKLAQAETEINDIQEKDNMRVEFHIAKT
jgi:hypothetical protein